MVVTALWPFVGSALLIAGESLDGSWGGACAIASVGVCLALGLAGPPPLRAAAALGAALGSAVDLCLRAALLVQAGGVAALSVGATLPPALVGLVAALGALFTGRWWRQILALGRLLPTPP